jgi:hypothetical protein
MKTYTIKPLRWHKLYSEESGDYLGYEAIALDDEFHIYEEIEDGKSYWHFTVYRLCPGIDKVFHTLEKAKACAQKYHEKKLSRMLKEVAK